MNDGGPAFPCRMCAEMILEPLSWQRRDGRCLACKRAQANASNDANREVLRERARARYASHRDYWKKYREDRRGDALFAMKRAARRKVGTEIEAGRLVRGACGVCGAANADAHHDDYTRPLAVRWLCRRCHIRHDMEVSRAQAI